MSPFTSELLSRLKTEGKQGESSIKNIESLMRSISTNLYNLEEFKCGEYKDIDRVKKYLRESTSNLSTLSTRCRNLYSVMRLCDNLGTIREDYKNFLDECVKASSKKTDFVKKSDGILYDTLRKSALERYEKYMRLHDGFKYMKQYVLTLINLLSVNMPLRPDEYKSCDLVDMCGKSEEESKSALESWVQKSGFNCLDVNSGWMSIVVSKTSKTYGIRTIRQPEHLRSEILLLVKDGIRLWDLKLLLPSMTNVEKRFNSSISDKILEMSGYNNNRLRSKWITDWIDRHKSCGDFAKKLYDMSYMLGHDIKTSLRFYSEETGTELEEDKVSDKKVEEKTEEDKVSDKKVEEEKKKILVKKKDNEQSELELLRAEVELLKSRDCVICCALTKKGKGPRCSKRAKTGSKYCGIHS
ncbi:MAG: hypothetical protein JKY53_13585 [Flavobacteriales bacterium]|nr:hypothetical protein [Flavobacteriales bacterium]